MALNFPGSPTNGQQYQGFVYNSTVQAWQSNPASVAPFYTADLPPINPTVGDSWFNTNDGTMYIYTYDGNTYQWVEHRSEIAKSQVGLVPITPSSISMTPGGTATVGVGGVVTFTGATTVVLNNVFSSSYTHYLVQTRLSYSALSGGWFHMASGGTIQNGANYNFNQTWGGGSSMTASGTQNSTYFAYLPVAGYAAAGSTVILNPAEAKNTMFIHNATVDQTSNYGTVYTSGGHQVATAYDGLGFGASSGNFTGTIKVYGYN